MLMLPVVRPCGGQVRTLEEMIRVCNHVDPVIHKMSQALHLAVGAALQGTSNSQTCFSCGQPNNALPAG